MKAKILAALALAVGVSASAFADPIMLQQGGVYFKFNGNEQIAVGGATTYAGTNEINWGVFTMSTITKGAVIAPHDTLGSSGIPYFIDGVTNGGQITGMFYNVQAGTPSATNPFPAVGGVLDLYWRDVATYGYTDNTTNDETVRIDQSHATGYTQGVFLVRLVFASGMDPNTSNYIVGSQVPSSNGFAGVADSYANVDLSAGGLWATALDTDYFKSQFISDLRDIRFKNSYNYNPTWNNVDGGRDGIIGARLDDPGMAFAVPEPGVLSLMGLALVGMGAIRRRKQK